MYAWILARSDRPHFWQSFTRALMSDISDIQGGTTREGIHLGAMAGTIDLIERCYTGLEFRADSLWLEPRLPENISGLSLVLHYREHWLDVRITNKSIEIISTEAAPEPIRINFRGQLYSLAPKERIHLWL